MQEKRFYGILSDSFMDNVWTECKQIVYCDFKIFFGTLAETGKKLLYITLCKTIPL